MNKKEITSMSKFLSLILRHKPEAINIEIDNNGYVDVGELIQKINENKKSKLDFEILKHIVDTDEKNRYTFNSDFTKIRANQGHSVNVDVELEKVTHPDFLYHGTPLKFIDSILKEGLLPKSRLYVHLSEDTATAKKVGERRGTPIILKINAKKMIEDGLEIFISENNVYLTKKVPPKYIEKL